MDKKDNQFEHHQKLEELWIDDETEKHDDLVMRAGLVVGAVFFLVGVLAGSVWFGLALFIISCVVASTFTKEGL